MTTTPANPAASDIIFVSIEDFTAPRNNVATTSDFCMKIKQKIDDIVRVHDCFREVILPFDFNHQTQRSNVGAPRNSQYGQNNPNHGHGHNHNHNNHRGRNNQNNHHQRNAQHHNNYANSQYAAMNVRRPKLACSMVSSGETKELLGLLNKLTNVNLPFIQTRLLRFCAQHSCISPALMLVITKLHQHPTYSHLYMKLLKELSIRYSQEALGHIHTYIESLASDIPRIIEDLSEEPHQSNYDAFCLYNKKRDAFLNKYQASLFLYNEILKQEGQLVNGIIDSLCDAACNAKTPSTTYRIVTEMIILLIKSLLSNKTSPSSIKPSVQRIRDEIFTHFEKLDQEMPKKLTFQWEEIETYLNDSRSLK